MIFANSLVYGIVGAHQLGHLDLIQLVYSPFTNTPYDDDDDDDDDDDELFLQYG